jgi:hypothetical protein
MKTLPNSTKEEFLTAHIAHRLTLLRTFRERQKCFELEMKAPNNRLHGDLARCAKDSALISIRLLSGAMALRVLESSKGSGTFNLYDHREKRIQEEKKRRNDDIWINELGGILPTTDDLSHHEKQLLAGMLRRADKELAHLTGTFDDGFNTAKCIIEAVDLVERLLNQHLYQKVGKPMPQIDSGIGWNRYFFASAP